MTAADDGAFGASFEADVPTLPTEGGGAGWPTPGEKHIKALEQNPDMASDFDAKFGEGAAERALGLDKSKAAKQFAPQIEKLAIERQINDRATQDQDKLTQGAGMFGRWGELDDKARGEWVTQEKADAESAKGWWEWARDGIVAARREAIKAQPDAFPDGDPMQDWAERKVQENIAYQKRRRMLAEEMEKGQREAAKYGAARARTDDVLRGTVDLVANIVKGAGYAQQFVTGNKLSDVAETTLYRMGQWVEAKGHEWFPKDEARAQEFATSLAEGAGSMVGFMGPALAAKFFVNAGPKTIAAISGISGALSQSEMADDALKAYGGAKAVSDEEEANLTKVWLASLGIGATEAFPIAHLFAGHKGSVMRAVFMQAAEEGGQEWVQAVLENVVAREYYDPKRQWDDNAWEGALVGALLGGKTQVAAEAIRKLRDDPEAADPSKNEKRIQEAKLRIKGATDAEAAGEPQDGRSPSPDTSPRLPEKAAPASNAGQGEAIPADTRPMPAKIEGEAEPLKPGEGKVRGKAAPEADAVARVREALGEALPAGQVPQPDKEPDTEANIAQPSRATATAIPAAEPAKEAATRALDPASAAIPDERLNEELPALAADIEQFIEENGEPITLGDEGTRAVARIMLAHDLSPEEALTRYVDQSYRAEKAADESAKGPAAAGGNAAAERERGRVLSGEGSPSNERSGQGTAERAGGPQRGAEQAAEDDTVTDADRARFARVLASKAQRPAWAKAAQVSDGKLGKLIEEAVADGRLTMRNGVARRTTKAKVLPQGMDQVAEITKPQSILDMPSVPAEREGVTSAPPLLEIPSDLRVERAIEQRAKATKKPVPAPIQAYARQIEQAIASPDQFSPLLSKLKADKTITRAGAMALANLVGSKPDAKATRDQALATIQARHERQVAAERQTFSASLASTAEPTIGPDFGSFIRFRAVQNVIAREKIKAVHEALFDREAFDLALANLYGDKRVSTYDFRQAAEAYAGASLGRATRNMARAAIIAEFETRRREYDLARLSGVEPLVSGSNLDPVEETRKELERLAAERLAPIGVGLHIAPMLRVALGRPGVMASFAGQKAATANLGALGKAQELSAKGMDPEAIWKETGWFKRADGGWRFEIDDSKITFNTEDVSVPGAGREADRMRQLLMQEGGDINAVVRYLERDIASTEERIKELDRRGQEHTTLRPYIQELQSLVALARSGNIRVQRGLRKGKSRFGDEEVYYYSGPLDGLIKAPDLFKAYPQLRTVKVSITSPSSFTAGGSIDPTTRKIEVATSGDKEAILDTLIHEIQHAIQLEEGFDAGGNQGTLTSRTEAALFEVNQQIASLMPGSNIRFELESLRDQLKAQSDWFSGGVSGFSVTNQEIDSYRRLLGEVEARNATFRRTMTPESRAAFFPLSTEDEPAAEQFSGKELTRLSLRNEKLIEDAVRAEYKDMPDMVRDVRHYGTKTHTEYYGISLSPAYSGSDNPTPIATGRSNIAASMDFTEAGIATAIKIYGIWALRRHLAEHIAYRKARDEDTTRIDLVDALLARVEAKHPELAEIPGYEVSKFDPEGLIEKYEGKTYTEADLDRLKGEIESAIDTLEGVVIDELQYDDRGNVTGTRRRAVDTYALRYDFEAQGLGTKHSIDNTYPEMFAALYERFPKIIDEYRAAYAYLRYKSQLRNVGMSMSMNVLGRSPSLDSLGYYSKALEAARSLKQAKGTPEQMLAQLKSAGVKDAEIEATGLRSFLDGKKAVTRDEIVGHLEANRVGLNERRSSNRGIRDDAGDSETRLARQMFDEDLESGELDAYLADDKERLRARWMRDASAEGDTPEIRQENEQFFDDLPPYQAIVETLGHDSTQHFNGLWDRLRNEYTQKVRDEYGFAHKWSAYSLDPSNPTYRETVLHLPPKGGAPTIPNTAGEWGNTGGAGGHMRNPDYDRQNFVAGHFPEPNIVGHMMTSMTRYEGKPVYTIDQIQSDWGQKLRDGGVRDEAKIAELERLYREANAKALAMEADRLPTLTANGAEALTKQKFGDAATWATLSDEQRQEVAKLSAENATRNTELNRRMDTAGAESDRLEAEWYTARNSAPGHPLVNTTDQWVNTTLRRAVRQAAEAGADYIAIPHGDTVLSYNPGDEAGMRGFYGSRQSEGIVPKNLRKLLEKIDPAAGKQAKVDKLETTKGLEGWKGEQKSGRLVDDRQNHAESRFDKAQTGFTLFPLTDKVKASVMGEGQPMFSLAGTAEDETVHVEGGLWSGEFAPAFGFPKNAYKKIMAVATGYGPEVALKTFTHEEIHALRNLGVLTGKDWTVLSALARKTPRAEEARRLLDGMLAVDKIDVATHERLSKRAGKITMREIYQIDQRYRGYLESQRLSPERVEELLIEEVVAHAAADWADGRSYGTKIDLVLMKIRDFLEALGNFIKGNGFSTVDQVFNSVWSGELVKRQQEMEEAAADAAASAMFSFAGVKAKTANAGLLRMAERMEARGRKAKDIHRETGWFRGHDRLWRFEIDDSQALLNDLDAISKPWTNRPKGAPTGKDLRIIDGAPLAEVLDHPALMAAYPFLKQMKVRVLYGESLPAELNETGTFATKIKGNKRVMFVAVRGRTAIEVHRALLHELQHYVQTKEGWDSGASPKNFTPGGIDPKRYNRGLDLFPLSRGEWQVLEHERVLDQYQADIAAGRAMGINEDDLLRTMNKEAAKRMQVGMEGYIKSPGEAEANLTMDRAAMSAKERRAAFPPEYMPRDLDTASPLQFNSWRKALDAAQNSLAATKGNRKRYFAPQNIGDRTTMRRLDNPGMTEDIIVFDHIGADGQPDLSVDVREYAYTGSADWRGDRTGDDRFMALPPDERTRFVDDIERGLRERNLRLNVLTEGMDADEAGWWWARNPAYGEQDVRYFLSDIEDALYAQYGDGMRLKEGNGYGEDWSVSVVGPDGKKLKIDSEDGKVTDRWLDGDALWGMINDARKARGEISRDEVAREYKGVDRAIIEDMRRGEDGGLVMFSFAGVNARTADKAALAEAEQMEAEGVDRDTIWRETGWGRFPDGKWRTEISDDQARLSQLRTGEQYKLSEALDHPEIYAAYPEAADTLVYPVAGGGASYTTDAITLGMQGRPSSTILHEIDHAIQQREDFAFGASPATVMAETPATDVARLRERLKAQHQEDTATYPDRMQTFLDTEDKRADILMRIDALNAEFNAIMDDPKARRKSKARLAEIRSDWDAALAELRVTPAVRRPVDPGSSPDTPEIPLYESYAGEVSARTVEKRRSMTPEERRARPPWYDFDVPEGEQIVRFANGGSAASVDDTSGPVMASFAGRASKRTTKSTGAPSLDAVITDLKNALGLNITQGLWGLTVRQGDRQVKLRPRKNVVGQFRRDSGVMSVRQSRDLTAIAHEGGHGLEMLLGTDLDGMKSRHFRELLSPVLPDRPAPTLAPGSGYSGVELDSEEQQRLVEATVAAIVWRDKQASPDYVKPEAGWFGLTPADPDETRATQGEAALAELVGMAPARAFIADMLALQGGPGWAPHTTAAARYSETGTPRPRTKSVPTAPALSEGFARWFEAYVADPDRARRQAPGFTESFEDYLDAEMPKLLADIHSVQAAYKAHREQAPLDRLAGDLVSAYDKNSWDDLAQDGSFENITGKLANAYTGIFDDLAPIRRAVKALLAIADKNGVRDADGKPISLPVHANPYKLLRLFRDSFNRGRMWLEQGIADPGDSVIKGPSLRAALETAFGGTGKDVWNKENYRKLGAYLVAQRAIAEYDRLDAKQAEIAQADDMLAKAAAARQGLAATAARDAERLGRREDALIRVETRLTDANRARRSAETEMQNAIADLAEAQDALLAAQMARDGRLELTRRRAVQRAEARQREAVRDLDAIREDVEEREVERIALQAEIEQEKAIADASAAKVANLDAAVLDLKAHRARIEKRGASRPPTLQPKEEHERLIAELDKEHPSFAEAATMVHAWTQRLLTVRHKAGFIDDALYAELSSRADWYVPFQRDMTDATAQDVFFRQSGGRSWSPFKKFDGSDRAIINPLEVLSQEAYRTAQQIAFNEAAGALIGLAERVGPGGGEIAERLTRTETAPANAQTFERIKDAAVELGIDPADAHLMVQGMEQNFSDADVTLIWSPDNKGPVAPPVIPYWQNGERQLIRLTDPKFGREMFDAINGLGEEMSSLIIEWAAAPARWLRAGVTTHPNFILRNLLRDIPAAFVRAGAVPVVAHLRGAYHLAANDEFLRLYNEVGGIVGGQNVASVAQAKKRNDVRDLRNAGPLGIGAGKFLKTVEAIESAGRLGIAAAAYKRALAYNPSLTKVQAMQEAAFVTRDVYDWGRRGSKMLAATRLITFLNANLQSVESAYRGVKGQGDRGDVVYKRLKTVLKREAGDPLSADEERDLAEAYKTWMRLAVVTLYFMALYAAMKDDPWYEDIKDGTKSTHSWVKMSRLGAVIRWRFDQLSDTLGQKERTDAAIKMIEDQLGYLVKPEWMPDWLKRYMQMPDEVRQPKPFEWALPANIAEIVWDRLEGRDPRAAERIRGTLFEVLAPPGLPQTAEMLIGLTKGYDVRNKREIISDQLKSLPPHRQFDAYASELAIDTSAAMYRAGLPNGAIVPPKMIDWVLTTQGAYWGKEVANTYSVGKKALGWSNREASTVYDLPIVAGVTGKGARNSKSIEEFWKLASDAGGTFKVAANGYKTFLDQDGNQGAAADYLTRLEPEERAYALTMYEGSTAEKREHPLERLKAVEKIDRELRREMILGNMTPKNRKGKRDFEQRVELSPETQTTVHDILERLSQVEARNTMILLDRPGWKGRPFLDPEPVLAELRAASPDVYDLLEERRQKAKAADWKDVQASWPQTRQEVLARGATKLP